MNAIQLLEPRPDFAGPADLLTLLPSQTGSRPAARMRLSRQIASLVDEIKEPARRLAAELDSSQAAAYIADRTMEIVYPDRAHDQAFRDAIYRSSVDAMDAMSRIIAGRETLDTATPLSTIEFADVAVRVGVQQDQFERGNRVASGFVWSYWYRMALPFAERAGTPLSDLLGGPMMLIVAYIDGLCSLAMQRFISTLNMGLQSNEQRRRAILRAILDGSEHLTLAEVEEELAIPVGGEHIAIVVRGRKSDRPQLGEYLRRSCDASSVMVYRHAVDSLVIWLSRHAAFGLARRRRLVDALERAGAPAALGEPRAGLAGLTVTAREALEAAHLQELLKGHADVAEYADLRLEAMFLADPDRARRFVADELGPLLGDGARMAALRDTALEWLSSGSHVATAKQLMLHEHTVRNRVAQIEELIGHGIAERRTELLVALRLLRMLESIEVLEGNSR